MYFKLRELHLSRNGLKHQAAEALACALEKNMKLQKLDLSHNEIGPKGVGYCFWGRCVVFVSIVIYKLLV